MRIVSLNDIKRYLPTIIGLGIIAISIFLFGSASLPAGLFVALIALFAAGGLLQRYPDLRPSSNVILLAGLWLMLTTIHAALGYDVVSGSAYFTLLAGVALYWLGESSVKLGGRPSRVCEIFLIFGLVVSAVAVFQHFLLIEFKIGLVLQSAPVTETALWLTNDNAAVCLAVIVLASIGHIFRVWAMTESKSGTRPSILTSRFIPKSAIGFSVLLFALTALILTRSSSILILTTILAVLLVAQCMRQLRRSKKGSVVTGWVYWAACLSVFMFTAFLIAIQQNAVLIYGINNVPEGFEPRSEIWAASINTFQYKPISGHGLAHYNEALLQASNPINNLFLSDQKSAYNFILQTLVQSGLLGLAAIAFAYFVVLNRLFQAMESRARYRTYIIAVICISVLIVTQGLFNNALEIPAIVYLHAWLLGFGHGIVNKYG